MADLSLEHDVGMHPWAASLPQELFDDDAPGNYDGAGSFSEVLHVDGASHLEVYAEVAVEAGQEMVLSFQVKWEATSDWYDAWDGDNASVGSEEFVFNATGNYALLLDTGTRQVRAKYGYRGGTGASPAAMKVTIVGKRAF
jgi:hypothetical protein